MLEKNNLETNTILTNSNTNNSKEKRTENINTKNTNKNIDIPLGTLHPQNFRKCRNLIEKPIFSKNFRPKHCGKIKRKLSKN